MSNGDYFITHTWEWKIQYCRDNPKASEFDMLKAYRDHLSHWIIQIDTQAKLKKRKDEKARKDTKDT